MLASFSATGIALRRQPDCECTEMKTAVIRRLAACITRTALDVYGATVWRSADRLCSSDAAIARAEPMNVSRIRRITIAHCHRSQWLGRAVSAMRALVLVGTAIGLVGCAAIPSAREPIVPLTPAALGAHGETIVWPAESWWTVLGALDLDAWIDRALAGNPTLAIAQARLERARAAVAGARSVTLPQVEAGGDVTHQRYSDSGLLPPPIAGSSPTTYLFALDARWELDFFGRNHSALRAALSVERSLASEQQAARVLISTSVARTWLQLARLQEQRVLAASVRQQRVAILALVEERVRRGLDTAVELRQAEATVPQIERELAALNEQIELTRHALAALAGAGPEAADSLSPRLPPQQMVEQVVALPAALPADLIGRRADLVAARWRVEAAARQIDVARAQFYPNVNLVAAIGVQSLTPSQWLTAGSAIWSLGPAVRLPVFEGGRLRAELRGAGADYDAAVASYNETLIQAVRDVADAVVSLRAIGQQSDDQARAELAAQRALDLAMQRYRAGLGNFLTVLLAESTVFDQRRIAIDLAARGLDERFQLVRALGGGYDEAMPAPAPVVAVH
jgi:NodT family efflux transporter outer membrane factor (OMF) lipoprotein